MSALIRKISIQRCKAIILVALFLFVGTAGAQSSMNNNAIVGSEFIFTSAPFASAHASTIVETESGLVAAWFGGSHEGANDVVIWLSRNMNGTWLPPVAVAKGMQPDGSQLPCWNLVLFQPAPGVLQLYFKVGPGPSAWWGMMQTSRDGGVTWSKSERLPSGVLGPIKNKPVQLKSGIIVSGSSSEQLNGRWDVHFEISADSGRTWSIVKPPDSPHFDAIQPSILLHADGRLQAVGRSKSERIFESWSNDDGKSWSAPALRSLPNPNSGIDAVTLRDGRQLIVYNHTPRDRSPLNVATSRDGKNWSAPITLESEAGEYSYPAVIQSNDGLVHITYTWRRRLIKHVVIDPK